MTLREFLALAGDYNISAAGCTAQALLETGFFRSALMVGHRNYWGIKCTRRWTNAGGTCWSAKTREEYASGDAVIVAGFAHYDTDDEAFAEYEGLIQRLYPVCRDNLDNVWLYLSGLAGKWATDRRYLPKLAQLVCVSVAPEMGLSKDDLTAEYSAALARGLKGEKAAIIGEVLRRV